MQPINGQVFIKPLDKADRIGSILLPEVADMTIRGEVVGVASDVEDLVVGDTVAVRNWIGEKVKLEGVDYLLVEEKEILGSWETK